MPTDATPGTRRKVKAAELELERETPELRKIAELGDSSQTYLRR